MTYYNQPDDVNCSLDAKYCYDNTYDYGKEEVNRLLCRVFFTDCL